MGKDGSKWAHGYIPENGPADALKAHRTPGGHTGSGHEQSRDAFKAGSSTVAARAAHRDAASKLRREANASNSMSAAAESKKLATLHTRVANGKMSSTDARTAAAQAGSVKASKAKAAAPKAKAAKPKARRSK